MARTAIPLTNLTKDNGINEPAGTAVDQANGHYVDCSGLTGQLILWVNNTFAGTKVVTVKAGGSPPAFRKDLGDLAYTAQASGRSFIGPLEAARFVQQPGGTDGGTGGRIFIDLAAGITGTIAALFIPDTV
ncbi:MAG TPA: hypothetical protein VFA96_02665 [Nocardioides sp.]|nr:hypothetical protein [Nocardioides sp.]